MNNINPTQTNLARIEQRFFCITEKFNGVFINIFADRIGIWLSNIECFVRINRFPTVFKQGYPMTANGGIFIKIMNITRRKSFRHALSTVGWLLLIISLVIYYSGIFDKNDIRYFFYGALALSGILIFFLNRPGENIFARIGSGIWDSYGMVTGLFGDILSYIRLFALGISSAILGFVFNDISLELLNIPYIGWLFFLVLLIAGHGINIFLATLGGFIHPMRLTFVEFYKNADFKGGGEKYQPFVINN